MTRAILFVGVGKMGLPMARHLHASGHAVSAFDIAPQRMALAAAAGLTGVALGADGDRIAGAYTERCGQVYRPDCAAEHAAAQEDLGSHATVVNAMIAVSVVGVGAAIVGAVLELGGRRRPGPTALRMMPHGVELRW